MSPLVSRLIVLAAVGVVVAIVSLAVRTYFSGGRLPAKFDLGDAGVASPSRLLVEFVSPYCYECKEVLPLLKAASMVHGAPLAVIDAKEQPELASKYAIRHTPTVLVVDSKGSVRGSWAGTPPETELEAALVAANRPKTLPPIAALLS